jgi:hypothetical protein
MRLLLLLLLLMSIFSMVLSVPLYVYPGQKLQFKTTGFFSKKPVGFFIDGIEGFFLAKDVTLIPPGSVIAPNGKIIQDAAAYEADLLSRARQINSDPGVSFQKLAATAEKIRSKDASLFAKNEQIKTEKYTIQLEYENAANAAARAGDTTSKYAAIAEAATATTVTVEGIAASIPDAKLTIATARSAAVATSIQLSSQIVVDQLTALGADNAVILEATTINDRIKRLSLSAQAELSGAQEGSDLTIDHASRASDDLTKIIELSGKFNDLAQPTLSRSSSLSDNLGGKLKSALTIIGSTQDVSGQLTPSKFAEISEVVTNPDNAGGTRLPAPTKDMYSALINAETNINKVDVILRRASVTSSPAIKTQQINAAREALGLALSSGPKVVSAKINSIQISAAAPAACTS